VEIKFVFTEGYPGSSSRRAFRISGANIGGYPTILSVRCRIQQFIIKCWSFISACVV